MVILRLHGDVILAGQCNRRLIPAEKIDIDKDVFAVVEVEFVSLYHYFANGVGRSTQHHDCTHRHTRTQIY